MSERFPSGTKISLSETLPKAAGVNWLAPQITWLGDSSIKAQEVITAVITNEAEEIEPAPKENNPEPNRDKEPNPKSSNPKPEVEKLGKGKKEAAGSKTSSTLPRTGAETLWPVGLALVLLSFGTLLRVRNSK